MNGFLAFLNHWWNVPFLVLVFIVVLYVLLQVVGLVGDGHHHDVDAGGDGHDVDASHGHGHAHADHAAWHEALAWLGVGRVPFIVIWTTLFLFGGIGGLAFNRVAYGLAGGRAPAWLFPVALVVALIVGLACVRVFGRLAAKLVTSGGKPAIKRRDLVGRVAVVASAQLDERFGEIRIDDGDAEQLVHAHLAAGDAPLVRGAKVIVIEWDEAKELYLVAVSPDDAAA